MPATIAYLTDVEGRWDKLASFAEDNPHVALEEGRLRLANGVTFVFGGDAIDRGPHGRRIVDVLLAARRDYGDRVVLLAGNRDINKLRLWRELDGAPPERTPPDVRAHGRAEILRWIFANTMGAREAFGHRATELAAEGRRADDDSVVQSYLDDLAPGGALRAYLDACRLAFRSGTTLFVHGAVTDENVGVVPGRAERVIGVDAWISALNDLYADEMSAFAAGSEPKAIIAYQAPLPGRRVNPTSVVYGRLADDHANPCLPGEAAVTRLRASGIERVVVGHTPSGDCPSFVREGPFEVVMADNSYGRVERGPKVVITDATTTVDGLVELDDGSRARVKFTSDRYDQRSPLGMRDRATGRLVKARLADGAYLLYRGLPGYRMEQTATSVEELAGRDLALARE